MTLVAATRTARMLTSNPGSKSAPTAPRRGIVCVIAMLFLVLFVVLAVGFYAATTMSMQLSANERLISSSQVAAESGMQFVRYQMACLDIAPEKPADKIFEEAYHQLRAKLASTANLAGRGGVGYDGTTIAVPADPTGYVALTPGGAGFRATLTNVGVGQIRVKVTGTPGSAPSSLARSIEVDFVCTNRPSAVFDYGVASVGTVVVKGSPTTTVLGSPTSAATILSASTASPSITTGMGPIDGKLFVMNSSAQVSLGGGTVGGASTSVDILSNQVKVVARPSFPTVDTAAFKALATNLYNGASHQKNIRVPAGTNPTFNAGDVVDGVLFIESPNSVSFTGNSTINGVIVFEDRGDATANVLDFRGNVSPGGIPNTPEFDALRARAKGLAIAAPTAALTMSGSVDGFVSGSVIAWSIDLAASADLTLTQGSLIARGPNPLNVQGKAVTFVGSGRDNPPYAGVRVQTYFKPDPGTYREVRP